MNDDPLKREIEDALAVEPSPQFVARVRQHLAKEGLRRPVLLTWTIWAGGLAMAALLVGILAYRPQQTTAPLQTRNDVKAVVPKEDSPAPQLSRPLKATRKPVTRKAPAEPEVLIDPRETAAFRSFLEDIHAQRIDPARLEALFEAAERSRSNVIEPMPVAELEPIVIPPLAPVLESEGGSL